MKSSLLIYIILGVMVIGVVVMAVKNTDKSAVSSGQNQTETEETAKEAGALSMKELVDRNESVRCTFTHDTDASSSSGEVFVAQGKVRGDFDVTSKVSGGQTFEAHMISDGSMSYVWSSVIPQGIRIPLSQIESDNQAEPVDGISYNQKLNYSCFPWTADSSVFVPPTSVIFMDLPQAQ